MEEDSPKGGDQLKVWTSHVNSDPALSVCNNLAVIGLVLKAAVPAFPLSVLPAQGDASAGYPKVQLIF
jgi:hypothetical protein